MDFVIRQAVEKDYAGLAKLFQELNLLHSSGAPDVFITPPDTPQDIKYIRRVLGNDNCILYVAQAGGDVVGMVEACIRESPADIPVYIKRRYIYVDNICVLPGYRRSSIGKKLMESVEDWARQKRVFQIEFNVWDFNGPALAFYKSIGYKPRQHILGKNINKRVGK